MSHNALIRTFASILVALVCGQSVYGSNYSSGAGTSGDPWQIANASDWTALSATPSDWDKNFILVAEIDFQGASLMPVGNYDTPFTGVFDGGGHAVRNAVINLPTSDYVGVFGHVGEGGVLRDLGVENMALTGELAVGGLVGWNEGDITSCYATGMATASDGYVGGLVGWNSSGGAVTSCYATGAVTGYQFVGGLAGANYGVLTSSYAIGAVTGTSYVGGLVGDGGGAVMSCFWDMETTVQEGSAGGKGLATSQMQMLQHYRNANWSAYAWVMQEGNYPRLAWEGIAWAPIPAAEPIPLTGSGTQADPYRVTSPSEFALLSWHTAILDAHIHLKADLDLAGVNLWPIGDLGTFTGVFDGGGYALHNAVISLPTSDYVGVFARVGVDGVLRDLGVENVLVSGRSAVGGLMGSNRGAITSCYATGAVTGYQFVGGLAGSNRDAITSCFATCTVTGGGDSSSIGGLVGSNSSGGAVTSCYATGAVTGNRAVGGMVGFNYQSAITLSYATGTVTGGADSLYVGGLVGMNFGSVVSACYAMGAVSGHQDVGGLVGWNRLGGSIMSCYSTGTVTGNGAVGGLAGRNNGGISSCYWDVNTSGQSTSDGGEGRTTVAMTYPYAWNTYVEWDFTAFWAADEDYSRNQGYPYLRVPLSVAPSSRSVGAAAGETNFDITTTVAWVAESSEAWATLGAASGMGNATLIVVHEANTDLVERSATVTVTGVGTNPISVAVTVTQEAASSEGEGEGEPSLTHHSADLDRNWELSISEIQRVVGYYNAGTYHCDSATIDGYNFGQGPQDCKPHDSDFEPQNWMISVPELQRLVAFYNAGGYVVDPTQPDGYGVRSKFDAD